MYYIETVSTRIEIDSNLDLTLGPYLDKLPEMQKRWFSGMLFWKQTKTSIKSQKLNICYKVTQPILVILVTLTHPKVKSGWLLFLVHDMNIITPAQRIVSTDYIQTICYKIVHLYLFYWIKLAKKICLTLSIIPNVDFLAESFLLLLLLIEWYRAPSELMLCYLCYFDFFQYEWQIGFVDMLVFLSQPTELP